MATLTARLIDVVGIDVVEYAGVLASGYLLFRDPCLDRGARLSWRNVGKGSTNKI